MERDVEAALPRLEDCDLLKQSSMRWAEVARSLFSACAHCAGVVARQHSCDPQGFEATESPSLE